MRRRKGNFLTDKAVNGPKKKQHHQCFGQLSNNTADCYARSKQLKERDICFGILKENNDKKVWGKLSSRQNSVRDLVSVGFWFCAQPSCRSCHADANSWFQSLMMTTFRSTHFLGLKIGHLQTCQTAPFLDIIFNENLIHVKTWRLCDRNAKEWLERFFE